MEIKRKRGVLREKARVVGHMRSTYRCIYIYIYVNSKGAETLCVLERPIHHTFLWDEAFYTGILGQTSRQKAMFTE